MTLKQFKIDLRRRLCRFGGIDGKADDLNKCFIAITEAISKGIAEVGSLVFDVGEELGVKNRIARLIGVHAHESADSQEGDKDKRDWDPDDGLGAHHVGVVSESHLPFNNRFLVGSR